MKDFDYWMTLEKFINVIEQRECCRCEKKATYFSEDAYFCYCDEHFPYKNEKCIE